MKLKNIAIASALVAGNLFAVAANATDINLLMNSSYTLMYATGNQAAVHSTYSGGSVTIGAGGAAQGNMSGNSPSELMFLNLSGLSATSSYTLSFTYSDGANLNIIQEPLSQMNNPSLCTAQSPCALPTSGLGLKTGWHRNQIY